MGNVVRFGAICCILLLMASPAMAQAAGRCPGRVGS